MQSFVLLLFVIATITGCSTHPQQISDYTPPTPVLGPIENGKTKSEISRQLNAAKLELLDIENSEQNGIPIETWSLFDADDFVRITFAQDVVAQSFKKSLSGQGEKSEVLGYFLKKMQDRRIRDEINKNIR